MFTCRPADNSSVVALPRTFFLCIITLGKRIHVNYVSFLGPLGKKSFDVHFYYHFILHPFVPRTPLCLHVWFSL